MNYHELSIEQRRQVIDVQQAYAAWRPAMLDLERLGTMRVQSSKGSRYVYEVHSTVRKSLGRESQELKKRKAEHDAKRLSLQKRVKQLEKRIAASAAVNKALRLGSMREIAARIIRLLDREQLLGSHVIVAGTNALHAYETAAGVMFSSEHVATTDADILWDTKQSLLLAATGVRREGLMGILKKVDKSFVANYGFNATNDDGYIVDLLCAESDDAPRMKPASDVEATPMTGAEWLLQCPQFEQVIVAEDGLPLRMVVPDPRTYALHKLWVSQQPSRTPIKRPRNSAHARIVAEIATKYLGLKFKANEMSWLSKPLREQIKHFK